ncbi:hypothetical protein N7G274_006228 [Stereocaulon virgatum]|uniref:Uncharacterized protein n=1 Tax=Stereocaulon virgatum TaxID=373712 RepID=A0ABR4A6R7_9LECA
MTEMLREVNNGHGDDVIERLLEYSSGSASLLLHPISLTWSLWGATMEGIKLFIFSYEPVSMNFGVSFHDHGIGFGLIAPSIEHLPAVAVPSLTSHTSQEGSPSVNGRNSTSLNAPLAGPIRVTNRDE